jgi:hypothetical protein
VTSTLLAGGLDDAVNENFETVSTAVQKVIFYSVKINGVDFPLVVAWLAWPPSSSRSTSGASTSAASSTPSSS